MLGAALLALGLVLVIEGLAYALAPSFIERMLEALAAMPLQARRIMGLLGIVGGLLLIWLAGVFGATVVL